jgi:hypothetical protein
MDATMEEMVKKGHESRPLLNELSQHADQTWVIFIMSAILTKVNIEK